MDYEAVIGLEVHVQLKTASKMFSRAPNGFAQPPNTLTDPVILGLPGALPCINRQAVALAIQTGLICDSEIAAECKWDRKNYWYPDSPKNYQISQYDQPICRGGTVEIELPGASRNVMGPHRLVRLTRIHLEEDVGKLTHFENDSLVDLNRAGTPLLEIVTEPDLHSGEECFAFLTALRLLLTQAGISDCDMEKGQMRCDANVSVRPTGQDRLGTKVEIKNLNTISGVRQGVDYEIKRQTRLCLDGRGAEIVQETRRWNAAQSYTTALRSKERSHDYRYFPDPDLLPVRVAEEWKADLRRPLPERIYDRQRRYFAQFQLPYSTTSVLIADPGLARFFEETAALGAPPLAAANWLANDLLRELAAAAPEGSPPPSCASARLTPANLAALIRLQQNGTLSSATAREVFNETVRTGEDPAAIVERRGLRQNSDSDLLEKLCAEALAAHPGVVTQFKAGQEKALNALKGPVMKASGGKANPKMVDAILRRLIDGL